MHLKQKHWQTQTQAARVQTMGKLLLWSSNKDCAFIQLRQGGGRGGIQHNNAGLETTGLPIAEFPNE